MPVKRLIFICCCCLINILLHAQAITYSLIPSILKKDTSNVVRNVMGNPGTYRLQIIYTQINRDKKNKPSFKNYYFNVDANNYFNPASTVKLPLALLALEKLYTMQVKDVNKYTVIQFDSSYSSQTIAHEDSTSQSNLPSIAHYIKKAFLISDNDAYNRLYEFVGQQTINQNLHDKGYKDLRITRRFTGMNADENRHTNAVRFIDTKNNLLYTQPPAYNTDSFHFSNPIRIGNAYYNRTDSLIHEPIDFTFSNNLPLKDLQQIMQSVLFPESVPEKQRFHLSNDDYRFVYQYLSQYPSETNYPKYDTAKYFDSYVKFYFYNDAHLMPPQLRVFNKVGWAYGFLTDVSYIADFKNNIEFMLTATMYVNSDGILNDDKYDYDSIGHPFFYRLGQNLYQYELQRKRKYKPNLDKFKITYEHRDSNDKRPSIKDADN